MSTTIHIENVKAEVIKKANIKAGEYCEAVDKYLFAESEVESLLPNSIPPAQRAEMIELFESTIENL